MPMYQNRANWPTMHAWGQMLAALERLPAEIGRAAGEVQDHQNSLDPMDEDRGASVRSGRWPVRHKRAGGHDPGCLYGVGCRLPAEL
eukprot:9845759-Prorocentrum_lima.AAC.1